MNDLSRPGHHLIDRVAQWEIAASRLGAVAELAVDIEADGFHRYPERLSLIQVGLPDASVFLIDPLALDDLQDLGRVLADATVPKIFHSASFDLRSLDRDYGFPVRGSLR